MPFTIDVPSDCVPFTFVGCHYTGFPFPTLITLQLKVKKKDGGESILKEGIYNNYSGPSSLLSHHSHFDPILEYGRKFIRLTKVKVYTLSQESDKDGKIN